MKWWLPGGLSVLLGCGATGALAEDLQWRPARSAPPTPTLVRTQYEPTVSASEIPAFRPVSLARPTPLVRAQKADLEFPRPMPSEPTVKFATDKNDPPKTGEQKKTETNPPLETITVTPRVLSSTPPGRIRDDNRTYSIGGPSFRTGASATSGGSVIMDDCCDPCIDPCSPCVAPSAFDACACCMDRPAFWFRAEYLLWKIKGDRFPVLVTAGDPSNQAVLGERGTRILLDDSGIENDTHSGARFTAGFWLPGCDCVGFEASYFFLNRRTQQVQFGRGDGAVIGRPFTEVNAGVQDGQGNFVPAPFERVEFVRFPGALEGTVSVERYAELWGAEANLRAKLWCNPCAWVDVLAGFRHFQLREGVSIREDLETLPSPGATFAIRDQFDTRNVFNGGQVGLEGEYRFRPRLSIGGYAKVALGTVRQTVNIQGSTTFSDGTEQGGLLALETNIGRHERSRFAVLPEVGLRLNYDLTDHLRVYAGYTFMYLSSAVRPGEQIDTQVNTGFVPRIANAAIKEGPRNPAVLFRTSDFWAQGVNFGLEYHW